MDDTSTLDRAYEPLTQAMRSHEFGAPVDPDAWPAELIAAHVILSTDLFTEAMRAVARGETPRYDNEPTLDGDVLREVLLRTGALPELANEVERAASDQRAAYEILSEDQRRTLMHTRIRHRGALVVDGERPVADMVDLHVTEHLPEHLARLLELREDDA